MDTPRQQETKPAQHGAQTVAARWDDSEITNTDANVCNVSSLHKEVVMVFGVNKAWEKAGTDVHVKLPNRIILSPFAQSASRCC